MEHINSATTSPPWGHYKEIVYDSLGYIITGSALYYLRYSCWTVIASQGLFFAATRFFVLRNPSNKWVMALQEDTSRVEKELPRWRTVLFAVAFLTHPLFPTIGCAIGAILGGGSAFVPRVI